MKICGGQVGHFAESPEIGSRSFSLIETERLQTLFPHQNCRDSDFLLLIGITWEEEMWRGPANHIDTAALSWHFDAPWLSERAGTNRQTKCAKIHPLTFHLLWWQLPFRGRGRPCRRNSIEWWGTTCSTNIWISSHHCNEYLCAVCAWVAYSPSQT